MKRGIAAFDSAGDRYGQSRALRLITVITDTAPDTVPQDEPPGQECWRGESPAGLSEGDGARLAEEQAAACALYYAREAAASGIVVYTVSVGLALGSPTSTEGSDSRYGKNVDL